MDTFPEPEPELSGEYNTASSQFGPGFAALRNLRFLRLNQGNCNLNYLLNSTLQAFRNSSLEEIHLGSRSLSRMEACAFCGFPHLRSLHMNSAKLPVTYALTTLFGLQHRNMTEINFSGMSPGNRGSGTRIQPVDAKYLRTICVSRLNMADARLQGITYNALFESGCPFVRCLEEIDVSGNQLFGDRTALWLILSAYRRLVKIRIDRQRVYAMSTASCLLGLDANCKDPDPPFFGNKLQLHLSPSLQYANFSSMGIRAGRLPNPITFSPPSGLRVLGISDWQMYGCDTTLIGLPVLQTLDLSGNFCFNLDENFFAHCKSLRRLTMSNIKLNPGLFKERSAGMFRNLELLQTLDLSLNNLIHLHADMLRVQTHLKELNLAGNRLQSLSLNLDPLQDLEHLDLSHNMLNTLSPGERQALDGLAVRHNFSVSLRGNLFLCACSNLDFVQWLWTTDVHLDGDGNLPRNYTCVTDTGEASNTFTVMQQYKVHWRRCVGRSMLAIALAAFLLQLLALVIVYVLSRSWTHVRYLWKVMGRLRLPRREHFRRDVYVGYADADWEVACLTLPACLEERHGVRLLLRDFEEVPGSVRAESIVQHIDESWKIMLLVTRDFGRDEWLCGFTVQQAQRSITDTMPDRVIVVFMDDPGLLPPMASLNRLLRMVPETNVLHVPRDTGPHDPVWTRLARDILGENGR